MLNFTPEKLLVIGLIAVMVLGPTRLPGAARSFGRFLAELKRMSTSWQSQVDEVLAEPREALKSAMSEAGLPELSKSISDGASGVRKEIATTVRGDEPVLTKPVFAPDAANAPEDPSLN